MVSLSIIPAVAFYAGDDIATRLHRCFSATDVPIRADVRDAESAPQSKLLAMLMHHEHIGLFVRDALQRGGLLSEFLRVNRAIPVGATGPEAALLLAAAIVQAGAYDPDRGVPTRFLCSLGSDGFALSQLLRSALSKPHASISPHISAWCHDMLRRLVAGPVLDATLDALLPGRVRHENDVCRFVPRQQPKREPEVAPVPRAIPPLPPGPVTLASVSQGLSYCPEHMFDALRQHMRAAQSVSHPQLGWRAAASPPSSGFGVALLTAVPVSRRHQLADTAVVAAAFVRLAHEFRRPDGSLDVQGLVAVHPDAALVLADCHAATTQLCSSRTPTAFLGRMIDVLSAHDNRDNNRAVIDALVRETGLIPRVAAMPTLAGVVAATPPGVCTGEGLVATAHLFPTVVPMIEGLIAKGMNPKDVYLLGTPYGSDPLTIAYLRMLGCHVVPGIDLGGDTQKFAHDRLVEVHAFGLDVLHEIETRAPPARFRIHDDGGILQRVLAGASPLKSGGVDPAKVARVFRADNSIAQQHTTRGLTEIRKGPIGFQTILMASSPEKHAEGVVIGHDLVEGVLLTLAQHDMGAQRVGVVGLGAIGGPTAQTLAAQGIDVVVHDRDATVEQRLPLKATLGDAVSELFDAVPDGGVLSMTGKTAIAGSDILGFSGVLMSGSSAAVEFDREQLELFGPVNIANRGRPLNFRGDGIETLSPQAIALTRALMFIGLTQDHDAAAGICEVPLERERAALALRLWQESGGHLPVAPAAPTVLPRPDLLGACSHETWMNFLARRHAPVFPVPGDVSEVPGVYFFRDETSVRRIDTRVARSTSTPVALPAMPDRHMLASAGREDVGGWVSGKLKDDPRGKRYVARVRANGEVAKLRFCDALSANIFLPMPWENTASQACLSVRYPRAGDDGELLRWFSNQSCAGVAVRPRANARYFLQADETLFELDDAAVSVRRWERVGDGPVEVLALPPDVVRLHGLVQPGGIPVLSASTADGATLVQVVSRGAEVLDPVRLPAGATLRGIHYAPHWGARVSYTLPGDAVETDSLRTADLRFCKPTPPVTP